MGVWVNGAKIAAIGIHISRWISSHGFALNVDTDLSYFQYIVPCGLDEACRSHAQPGLRGGPRRGDEAIAAFRSQVFDYELVQQLLGERL